MFYTCLSVHGWERYPLLTGTWYFVGGRVPLVLSLVLSRKGVPPSQNRSTSRPPDWRARVCYVAGGTPLAVTQEDSLVSNKLIDI